MIARLLLSLGKYLFLLERRPVGSRFEPRMTPDSAFATLLKARDFDEKVEETDPDSGSNPTDDGSADAIELGPDHETRHELISAISDLNDDEQLDLVTLILVGRGDFTLSEWDEAR